MEFLIKILVEAAIAVAIHAEKIGATHVVLLGRDCWPLLPLLRKQGVSCSYFIFSRLQIGDEGTKMQWLREVPPHSLVVDTGYQGSIFDAIRKFDPSIRAVLLSSRGKYPALGPLPGVDHSQVVEAIEKFPKIIGRGVSINARGVVRCPQSSRDLDDNLGDLTPTRVVTLNLRLCFRLEIDPSWAKFTGIAPATRVPMPLDEWYDYVQQQCETCVPLPTALQSSSWEEGVKTASTWHFNAEYPMGPGKKVQKVTWNGPPDGLVLSDLKETLVVAGTSALIMVTVVGNKGNQSADFRVDETGAMTAVCLPQEPEWKAACKEAGVFIGC